ncbi:unnamed protein product [Euphydryas editha]|uniref:Uncharacterized protein n=1 Tax=Euphydryas editha TaxID=104508 RepID=A0AAU9TM71_EUPED|nr:unnamed protein product [Euphydryas editha]
MPPAGPPLTARLSVTIAQLVKNDVISGPNRSIWTIFAYRMYFYNSLLPPGVNSIYLFRRMLVHDGRTHRLDAHNHTTDGSKRRLQKRRTCKEHANVCVKKQKQRRDVSPRLQKRRENMSVRNKKQRNNLHYTTHYDMTLFVYIFFSVDMYAHMSRVLDYRLLLCITLYDYARGNASQVARLYREQVQNGHGPQPEIWPDHRMILRVHHSYMDGRLPGSRSRRLRQMHGPDNVDLVHEEVARDSSVSGEDNRTQNRNSKTTSTSNTPTRVLLLVSH